MGESTMLFFLMLLLNIIDSIFIIRYHHRLYGAIRWGKKRFALLLAIVILLAAIAISIVPAMILWSMALFSSCWLFAYPGEKKNKVLFQTVLISFAVLAIVLSFIIAIVCFKEDPTIGIFTLLASHVIFGAMTEATGRFNRAVSYNLPIKMWMLLFSIPAISLICTPAFSRMIALNADTANSMGRNQVIILFALVSINIMVFYLYGKFSELLSTQLNESLLQQQIKMQEKYYLAVEENHAKVRLLQHDMKNQIQTITTMFEEKQMENLEQYLKEVSEPHQQTRKMIVTGNAPIDTILNIKISELIERGISVSTEILIPKGIQMNFREAIMLFGNLLDNVMEECSQLPKEKRTANIQLSYTNHIMLIQISNPMTVAVKPFPLKSKKQDSELHGFGMKSIQQVVDHFDGTIKLTAQDHIFQASIVLYGI